MTSQAWWDTGIVGISLIMLIFGVLDITNMWVYTQLHNKLQYPHCMHILEIQYFNTKAWICNWINVSFVHIDGLVQDCGISWALALKILQSRIKPSMLCWLYSICLDAIEFHYNAVQYIMILHQVEHFPGNKLNAQKSVYILPSQEWWGHLDGLVQDCGISIASAMEIPLSCTKPLICEHFGEKLMHCKKTQLYKKHDYT